MSAALRVDHTSTAKVTVVSAAVLRRQGGMRQKDQGLSEMAHTGFEQCSYLNGRTDRLHSKIRHPPVHPRADDTKVQFNMQVSGFNSPFDCRNDAFIHGSNVPCQRASLTWGVRPYLPCYLCSDAPNASELPSVMHYASACKSLWRAARKGM